MKWIDIPPVWLALCLGLVWLIGGVEPDWATVGSPGRLLGTVIVGLGLVIMALALWEFLRARTTPIPHQQPSALITSGIFRISRNPIYLGDALVLGGLALRWDAPFGLILVPVFCLFIQHRFILAEEARLKTAFRDAFDAWSDRTGRWI